MINIYNYIFAFMASEVKVNAILYDSEKGYYTSSNILNDLTPTVFDIIWAKPITIHINTEQEISLKPLKFVVGFNFDEEIH